MKESDDEMKLIIAVMCTTIISENNLDVQAQEDELINDRVVT